MAKKVKTDPFYSILQVSMSDVINSQLHEIGDPFIIPLKTPSHNDRFMDDHKHYTKSNINVCYAAPRTARKPRNWYETQLTVSKNTTTKQGYPLKGVPFYVITDDGWGFLAHTTSQNNKQFAAVGDELILGKWIKGRLVEDGLVDPVEDVSKDVQRLGMITSEMFEEYGCNAVAFQKTDLSVNDPIDSRLSYEIWTLKLLNLEEDID